MRVHIHCSPNIILTCRLCLDTCAVDDDRVLRIVINDVIIRHDALWPRGLNELLYVQTPLEVAELRLSCVRHRWPSVDADLQPRDAQLNLPRLRARLQQSLPDATSATPTSGATATKKGGGGAPRAGTGAPPSTSTMQQTSPTKSTQQQQQSTKSSLPSPTNRRPATTTKSNTAPSPTKTPRNRPQSAPKPPPPPAVASSRPPQPSSITPHARPKSAKSATGGGNSASKPSRSSTTGHVASASAETEPTNRSSANGPSLSQPSDNTKHTSTTSTAESSDIVINAFQNELRDCPATVGSQQIPATV